MCLGSGHLPFAEPLAQMSALLLAKTAATGRADAIERQDVWTVHAQGSGREVPLSHWHTTPR